MAKIKQFDKCYVVVNDKGKPITDAFLTIEEAEACRAEWNLGDQLAESLLDAVSEWAERQASELGMTRAQVMARVLDVRLTDYGWPEG